MGRNISSTVGRVIVSFTYGDLKRRRGSPEIVPVFRCVYVRNCSRKFPRPESSF